MAILSRLIRSWAQVDRRLRRAPELLSDAVGALLAEALTSQEQSAASIAIYDTTAGSRAALFDWEAAWYTRALPAPPARVLLTGAGAGVEVAALLDRGYTVDAAEPAAALFARLARLPVRRAACVAHAQALAEASGPYDAVIFGWGSFTCVLDPAAHHALVEAAARVCKGPILFSFWLNDVADEAPRHRLARVGGRVGRGVGRLRGVVPTGDVRFRHWCGFGYVFSRAEIEALAARIGRHVVWGVGQYPHAALMPVADPSQAR